MGLRKLFCPTPETPAPTGGRLDRFIERSPIPIAHLDEDSHIIECNPAFHELTHHSIDTASPITLMSLLGEDQQKIIAVRLAMSLKGQVPHDPVELEMHLPDGNRVMVSLYMSLMPDATGKEYVVVHVIDNTEQKNLELRFAHSQKMQAVGQLAGGVAHDFNNLLTAMIGFCDLLLMRHPAGDPSFADIMQVKQNANRAANLVRQLLAFSRRQTLQPKVLDFTDTMAELSNLIRRLIGENIELNMIHGRDLWPVKADQGQLEQVIINLAVNARDAMKDGGTLTIRTSNITVGRESPIDPDFAAPSQEDNISSGDYIQIEIIDTGEGIPKDLFEKIFEPFFPPRKSGMAQGWDWRPCMASSSRPAGMYCLKAGWDWVRRLPCLSPATPERRRRQRRSRKARTSPQAAISRERRPSCWWKTKRRCASSPRAPCATKATKYWKPIAGKTPSRFSATSRATWKSLYPTW